jgi:2-polyprenyl-3-methyl-5-hydroxy-6-metoxy-1,4-benzoquinol methylase
MPLIDKDSFDAALMPGVRARLAPANTDLRQKEQQKIRSLLDEQGNFLPGMAYSRDCPGCGQASDQADELYVAHGMHILRCGGCELVYSRDIVIAAQEKERYEESDSAVAHLALKQNEIYAQLEQGKMAYVTQRLLEFCGPRGRLLDIGSSNGALLRATRDQGWSSFGIEVSPAPVRYCREQGLEVALGMYPQDLPEHWAPFDAIAAFDVLEHVPEPLPFLHKLHDQLAPGGWLLIQVPNFGGLLATVEGPASSNICHGHWTQFTETTLRHMVEACGFSTHLLETYITELDRIKTYPAQRIAQAWQSLRHEDLADPQSLTTDQLHRHMLGYKLFGIFQKV